MCIASIDDPHHLLIVVPAVLIFILLKNVTILPILKPCSPSGKAHPIITSSISSLLIFVFEIRFLITSDNKSSGLTLINSPFLAIVNGDLE